MSLSEHQLELLAPARTADIDIEPTTASTIVATVGKGHDFTRGRQFCTWLGLVPGQYSSGGKRGVLPRRETRICAPC